MALAYFSEYQVAQLIAARKFVFHVIQDTLQSKTDPSSEQKIVYDIRRRDTPTKDHRLRLCARLAPSLSGIGPKPTPGVSLMWRGKIIRKIDHSLRHDSIRDGVSIGHIRGWHEHVWTDLDEDKHVVAAQPPVRRCDIRSVISWAAEKWNIELDELDSQSRLGG